MILGTSCCLAPTGALSARLHFLFCCKSFNQICQISGRFILGGLVVVSDFGACELVLATYNSTDHCRPSVQLIPERSEAIWPDSLSFSNAGNCIFVVDLFSFYDRYKLCLDIYVLTLFCFYTAWGWVVLSGISARQKDLQLSFWFIRLR